MTKPEILAPAGDMPAALAAFAAGADAVYLGLKHFSARMEAGNFSATELARLLQLAHAEGRRVYVAMNVMLKPGDAPAVARNIARISREHAPDALIIQDPAMVELARQAGFGGELHFSTLANVSHQAALQAVRDLGATRAIIPRELSIEEIRLMSAARPAGLELELFVHGALCFCVSGRCWWSSYMGGKSGLRGRCVQPCRRVYKQKGREGRFFSCRDLSLDVLTKLLLEIPGLTSWKIEGRRKSPHYVYYAVSAYRTLRDNLEDPAARREAVELLELALGRPGTRARFLPQKDTHPVSLEGQTGSGLLCGKISLEKAPAAEKGKAPQKGGKPQEALQIVLKPRFDLLAQDYLRIGYEDESWHTTLPVTRRVPKGGSLTLNLPRHKSPKGGTPVFLIDRREPELTGIIAEWTKRLQKYPAPEPDVKTLQALNSFTPTLPRPVAGGRPLDITLRGYLPHGRDGKSGVKPGSVQGLWLSARALDSVSRTLYSRLSWWLPPVIWPDEEEGWKRMLQAALRNGARHFVCNAPWQAALFADKKNLVLTAGPFCNVASGFSTVTLRSLGFDAAIVSPELGAEDYLALPGQSVLPLGIVLGGFWPVGISRHNGGVLKAAEEFNSPKGEGFWYKKYGQNIWIYPAWPLDLSARRAELEKAGYSTFITIDEARPQGLGEIKRSSEFNWDIGVL